MSLFPSVVLEEYGLCLTQLHANAIVMLAICQHVCEAFVVVMPSVALFRHFFVPRVETSCLISGPVSLSFCPSLDKTFIPLSKKRWGP
jgi:hypothetical protein